MTIYLARLSNGSQTEATKINGVYTDILTGELITPVSTVNFDHITRDQYEFECSHRSFTLRGDYSKRSNLMYSDSLMQAAYKVWRIAKGYAIDDPDYKPSSDITPKRQSSPIYTSARHKGD